jgi:hypothetical protein
MSFDFKKFIKENRLGPYSKVITEDYDGGPKDLANMAKSSNQLRNNPITIAIAKKAVEKTNSKEAAADLAVKLAKAKGITDSEHITQIIDLAASMAEENSFVEESGEVFEEPMDDEFGSEEEWVPHGPSANDDRIYGLGGDRLLDAVSDLLSDGFELEDILDFIERKASRGGMNEYQSPTGEEPKYTLDSNNKCRRVTKQLPGKDPEFDTSKEYPKSLCGKERPHENPRKVTYSRYDIGARRR